MKTDLQLIDSFTADYDAKILEEELGGIENTRRIRLLAKRSRTSALGYSVSVSPKPSVKYILDVERGDSGLSGIFATPSSKHIVAIAEGQGFWVPVGAPTSYRKLRCYPIILLRAIPEDDLIVFGDMTGLIGIGSCGLMWSTPRLSWDGLRIHTVGDGVVFGEGWNAVQEEWKDFTVDLRTGAVVGGGWVGDVRQSDADC